MLLGTIKEVFQKCKQERHQLKHKRTHRTAEQLKRGNAATVHREHTGMSASFSWRLYRLKLFTRADRKSTEMASSISRLESHRSCVSRWPPMDDDMGPYDIGL
jgi:hypothetical protein